MAKKRAQVIAFDKTDKGRIKGRVGHTRTGRALHVASATTGSRRASKT